MPEIDRRDFLKLVGVGAGAAAAAGCSEPVEKLIPYVVQPEEITPGIPVTYASTCGECPAGCGLHVRTREGRPIKLEGNPEHPVNRGRLCARGQVGFARTYHPDRYEGPMLRGDDGELAPVSWERALDVLAERVREAGSGTFVLGGEVGPTLDALLDRFVSAVGAGGRVVYEPFSRESLVEATRRVFGVASEPVFDLSGADLVLDFGGDLLGAGLSPTEHARQLAEARDVAAHPDGGARLVAIAPRMTLTAANSDEWIAARPGTEGILALAIARVVVAERGGPSELRSALAPFDADSAAARTGVRAEVIERLGRAAARARSAVALPPGPGLASRRATATAGAVLVLDAALGAVGKSVRIQPAEPRRNRSRYREVLALIDAMNAGQVEVLLIHDSNPVYSLPEASRFQEALAQVPFVVATSPLRDETTERAHLVLPDHTRMESWGDASPRAGIRSLVQPTIRPLKDTRALGDLLLDLGRALGPEVAARLPSGSFRQVLEAAWADTDFREALIRGGEFRETGSLAVSLRPEAARLEVAEPLLEGDGEFVLLAFPTPQFTDGSGAALPWMQEIGDPVVKVAWEAWAELSHATAERLGVETGDLLRIETVAGSIELPALPRGGIRDDVIAVPIGQGHTVGFYASREKDGEPGVARGASVISILPQATDESGGRAWLTARARVTPTGGFRRLPFVQASDNQRGRSLGLAVPLTALGGDHGTPPVPEAGHGDGDHGRASHEGGVHHEVLTPYDPADDAHESSPYRWGMSIDLDRCTGCNACVAACYVENNIPVVGEENVLKNRIMSWIRIERYIGDGDREGGRERHLRPDREKLGETDVRFTPMLCQQCGAAPCESVCPVLATYHADEGLNGMIYNRCVGTRYCSNNCPYKVRRFNYRDYAREEWPGNLTLMLNPDCTVRQQGVMEKCTFCIQRIQLARQPAKDEGRILRDGEFTTACAQSCPTGAITFGNLREAGSEVRKRSQDPVRGYHALHALNTRPGITYLRKVVRGPVEG